MGLQANDIMFVMRHHTRCMPSEQNMLHEVAAPTYDPPLLGLTCISIVCCHSFQSTLNSTPQSCRQALYTIVNSNRSHALLYLKQHSAAHTRPEQPPPPLLMSRHRIFYAPHKKDNCLLLWPPAPARKLSRSRPPAGPVSACSPSPAAAAAAAAAGPSKPRAPGSSAIRKTSSMMSKSSS